MAALATVALATLVAAPPAAADVVRDRQWYLDALGVAEAHKITRGQGVTVAVIDTRAEIDHPDLSGNVLPGKDFIPDVGGGLDPGHGVSVASLVAGHGHGPGNRAGVLGVAPKARILPARADTNPIVLAEAIRWAVDQGATVISLSQAHGVNEIDLEEAVAHAQARDVVVVAGAGNVPQGDDEVQYPAAYPGVIAVSATNRSGRISDVSTTGEKIDLAAPGENVIAADQRGGYETSSGTSLATPIVAGTAALIRARYPDMNAASVVNRLIQTATDKGPQGKDPKYGHGIVDPVKALTADIPDVQTNPLGSLAKETPAAHATPGSGAAGDADSGGPGAGLLIGIAVAVLAVLAVLIALVVRLARRKPAPAGPHAVPPPAYGPAHTGAPQAYPPPAGPHGRPPYGPPGPPPGPAGPSPGAPGQPPQDPPQGPPPGWQPPPSPPRS